MSANLTAFAAGDAAREWDEEEGGLTDCPYTMKEDREAWYSGYNYRDEHPEAIAEFRKRRHDFVKALATTEAQP